MNNFFCHEVKESHRKVCGEERLERGKLFVKIVLVYCAETRKAEKQCFFKFLLIFIIILLRLNWDYCFFSI
jgi:hypothetical protein